VIERCRKEDGVALISAVIFLVLLLALGVALLSFTDTQTNATAHEEWSEQAYALAEGALNAQIFELSNHWPGTSTSAYPSSCNATNGATTAGCPSPSSLSAAYPTTGPSVCPATTAQDPWSAGGTTTNGWTTYVRSDGGSGTGAGSPYFDSPTVASNVTYDTGDHTMWVRAVGVYDCHMMTVVSKVTAQFSPVALPTGAIEANGFATANQGKKIIVDTIGAYAQPSEYIGTPGGAVSPQPGGVAMRCSGLSGGTCEQYRSGQVAPDTTNAPSSPAQTISPTVLNSLRLAAEDNGTYFGTDPNTGYTSSQPCPTSLSQLTGAPVFVEGPCTMSFKTTASANSDTSPGVLVINNGSLTLAGGATFFGVIYAVNAQNASGAPCSGSDVIHIEGSAEVQGAIIVDGAGTICFGESGGNNGTVTNFVYDDRGFNAVKGYFGAAATPDSFRVLPTGQ
jgi:Tfp pilus assembly protein PilX